MVTNSAFGGSSTVFYECLIRVDTAHRLNGVEIPSIQPAPVEKFAVKCIHGFVNGGSAEAMFRRVCAHVN